MGNTEQTIRAIEHARTQSKIHVIRVPTGKRNGMKQKTYWKRQWLGIF